MKQKKRFKKYRKHLIAFYNYQIKTHGSFKEFEKNLEKRNKREQRLKLRHMKYQRKQIVAENNKSKVIYFPQLQKVYLWDSKNLIKLPKVATDEWLAYSYLHVPPL